MKPVWPSHAVAVATPDREQTCADLCRAVYQCADRLTSAGVQPGDRLAVAHESPAVLLPTILACWQLGAVPCPINARWPEAQRNKAARRIGARWVEAPGPAGATPDADASPLTFSRDPGAWAIVVHTSGSSAEPKAAVLSWGNLLSGAENANERIPLRSGDRWLLSLPLYHVGGLGVVLRCMISGAAIALPRPTDSLRESLLALEPTHVSLVPTQLFRLLHDDDATQALARCKAVVMGGGPMPARLIDRALDCAVPLVTSYGMTETAAMIAATPPAAPPKVLRTSGAPFEADALSIANDGQVRVRGRQLFQGYIQDDGALHRPLDEDGWFRTGDLGDLDGGCLRITGRRDWMFVSGGENIQPEAVEQAIRDIDGVRDAVVVPVQDSEWGQKAIAFVDAPEPIVVDLARHLRGRLAGYQTPKAFYPWPADLAPAGLKPSRSALIRRAEELEPE